MCEIVHLALLPVRPRELVRQCRRFLIRNEK